MKYRTMWARSRLPVRCSIVCYDVLSTSGCRCGWALVVGSEYLWPGRFHERLHISTRQYARIVRDWVTSIGLEASAYGTHSMRRTKVTQIYKKMGNLRAVQLLLGHTKMDSTVRYLGVELEDALMISESIEI